MRQSKGLLRNASLLILVLSGRSFGGPASRASIPILTANADAIVVGSVQAQKVNGVVSATIDVERVLKGSVKPGSLISIQWSTSSWSAPDGRMPNGHGLLFFQKSSSGTWSLLPVTVGDIGWSDVFIQTPATIPANVSAAASASMPASPSALDNVLLEVVTATEAGGQLPIDLVGLFRSQRSPILEAAFGRFVGGSDPWLTVVGLRGLISMGDTRAIQIVQLQHTALSSAPSWSSVVEEIKHYYVSADLVAVSALGSLGVDSKTPQDLRVAAASALARIHSQATLPYLAQLLNDASPTLQAAGVGGLASFANNVPIGSHEPIAGDWKYRTEDTIAHSAFDESMIIQRGAYYLVFWKSWWNQNQINLSK